MNLRRLLSIFLLTLILSPMASAYYDPVQGRWCSRDPIGEQGGVNLYGFVGNDGVDDVAEKQSMRLQAVMITQWLAG